ncbi:unnamed protein product [Scytosiphon promiscuus]
MAAKPKKPNYPFGTPLSVLVAQSAAEGREDGLGYRAGGGGGGGDGGIDAEDQLPDPTLVEVARDGDGDGLPSDINDPRTRVAAARPEVVHALFRGLPEGQTRQVADTLCTYSGTARTTEDTLARLEEMLGQRSDNALDWAMPLIRAHVTGESKPSAETHGQYLTVARDTNIKEISPEEMSEKLLRSFARHKWGPDMTRERLRTEHPERWEEAMSLSNKLADRLPVCRYKLVGRTLENFLKADNTRRRHRVLGEIAKILKSRMHLVLPAIADFWRVQQLSKRLQDDIEQAKIDFLEEQALLARWLLFARTKAFPTVEELKGPWSIEEIEELQEARARDEARKWEEENSREDEDEEGDEDDLAEGVGGGEGEGGVSRHRQKKLNTAAIDVISRALPPQMPEIQQPDPLGLFELFVVEYPREFWRPPPPDIFGGDIPMGGQYTAEDVGLSEPLPVWKAAGAGKRETLTAIEEREAERERSARGEQYEWPEEKEARMKEEEEAWWRGAGDKKKELSKPRSQDYRQVEDVLLKGERVKRTPEVTIKDILEGLPMMQMKAQLAKRAALVAELHPDEERQKELQLEEEGSRTVFVRGLPYGLSPWTVKEAFARCGDVRQVIIKEPTFREGGGGGELLPSSAPSTTSKRAFEPKSQSPFATSVPHGLVVFNDHEAYERATAKSFRIFGVNIEGVSVTTKPASQCHTLFVENIAMRTGLEMTDAINEVISPHYEVGLKSHFLDDETPQVVAIPLRKYVAVRAMDQILTAAGFCTTFYYNVPKVPAHKACENDFSWNKPGDRRGRHASHFDEDEPMPADDFLQQALDELEERSAS